MPPYIDWSYAAFMAPTHEENPERSFRNLGPVLLIVPGTFAVKFGTTRWGYDVLFNSLLV